MSEQPTAQYAAPPQQWQPQPRAPRKPRRVLKIIGAVVVGGSLLGIGAGIGSAGSGTTVRTVTVNHTITKTVNVPGPVITKIVHVKVPGATVTKTAGPPPPSATMPGDGTFVVGTAAGQWAPGTWQTSGASSSGSGDCYWATLNDLTGGTNSIAANNIGPGPATFVVSSGLAGVQVSGCNTWNKIG